MAPDDPDQPDEPRGKDLLTRPREEIAAVVDPATMAELESWFARPSMAVVAEAIAVDEEQRQEAELLARRATAMEAVDPEFLAHIHHHNAVVDQLLKPRPEPTLHADETLVPAFIRDELTRTQEQIADERFFEQPRDITAALMECAPQAILRDLMRPVAAWDPRFEPVFDLSEMESEQVTREAMRASYRAELIDTRQVLRNARDAIRAITAGSWGDEVPPMLAKRKADQEAADRGGR